MCPENASDSETAAVHRRPSSSQGIAIETLADLNPHTDAILEALNADKKMLLLAAVDPAGVLKDLGYELSPQVARELRHNLPKMSREQRGRYIAWLREAGDISHTIDIRLVKQKSGHGLLEEGGGVQQRADTASASSGKGTGGFDVVAQFGETFCDRMLKRNYAFGYLPRSVYRVSNKLEYCFSSSEYYDQPASMQTADREIHFNQPTLTFPMSQADTPRVTSAFIAEGFGTQEIKGTAVVDAKLTVKQDSKGQPKYVEISFDSLTAADVTLKLTAGSPSAAVSAELNKMALDAYKNFSKSSASTAGIPLTFLLVDSATLAGKGTLVKLKTTVGIRKPAGASEPLLMVGSDRATNAGNGDLDSIPCAIKSGADFAMVQDSGWLEKYLNDGFAASMPIYFDEDTGLPDPNGDLRIDAINWSYRDGGLTGHVDATAEGAFLGINVGCNDFVACIDITFHSSDPTLEWEGSSGLPELPCWAKALFILGMAVFGALIGWAVGLGIGVAAGSATLGSIIGAGVGAIGGEFAGLALVGWSLYNFDLSRPRPSDETQKLIITHTCILPETGGSVTVKPNDFNVSEQGTLMSAKVIGPNYAETKPSVKIKGTFSAHFSLPEDSASSGSATAAVPDRNTGAGISIAGPGKGDAISQGRFGKYVVGSITLDYSVVSTSGLQGKLGYLWSFNGNPIGTSSSVDVEVPVTADMVKNFEYNQANVLGVISVTVTDSFGRTGTASETITIGNPQDLRLFVPAIAEERQYVDPIDRVGQREHGDPVSIVEWQREGDAAASQLGALKSLSTITIGGKSYAIAGTQKV